MIRAVRFLLLFAPLVSQAQFTYLLDQAVPVHHSDGQQLSMPWAGGLNAAEVNTMDLDGDGTEDLVIFDRMANKVITFLTRDQSYTPAPEYENMFPEEVSNWLLLRDFNCDGKKDIFTGDILGIKVYTNVSTAADKPEWQQYFFSTGFPGGKSTVIQTQGFENKVNLQLQVDDLPSISDVDGDGDLDILNIQYAGHAVEFHQNFSVENNWSCDSLEFKRITRSWGNFRDCHCGVFAFNGEDCPPESGGRTKHAGGKSLLALDLNGDQQQDLIFSEAECTLLYGLINEGTNSAPAFSNATGFPPANAANMVIFPAAYHEDVDHDGKKDLIVSPNIYTREYVNSDLNHSVWFYKNTGTASQPVFTLTTQSFLQGSMLDAGDNSVPAFADFDADGDYDLFISNHSSVNFTSTVSLYENTGSPASPSFTLLDEDYLRFSASRFYNVKIQFADMDGNGTQDLAFSATSFDNHLTNLYYLPNRSTTTLDFGGASLRAIEFSITSTENVLVASVDDDGLPDLLVGRSEGNLEYWRNTGLEGAPLFTLEDEEFLGLSSSPLRQNPACAAADLDADGNIDLVIGDQTGKLQVISDYRNAGADATAGETDIVFNSLLGLYSAKNLGGKVWPAVVNLFNTNKPAIAAGNSLGGIHLLKNDEGKSLPESPEVHVYPNPVLKSEVLKVRADRPGLLHVYTLLGQAVGPAVAIRANEVHLYQVPALASGLYVLKFTAGKRSSSRRLVIR